MPSFSPALPNRIARLARLARARLIWEAYAPVLAVPALILSLYLIATWLGLWEVAGDPARLIALIATLVVLGRGLWFASRRCAPTPSDALRRLEVTAGLAHRPLDTIRDHAVIAPDLWPAHVERARERTEAIRAVGRVPALSPRDPYGLRFIIPMLLGLALFLSFGVATERLRQSLSPDWLPLTNPYEVTFEAWVDPPDYTGRPPIYAQKAEAGDDGPVVIRAPEGSTLVVRASGASGLPRPRYVTDRGSRFLDPAALGRNSVEVRTLVNRSGTLDWRIGPVRRTFVVDATPDSPPEIESLEPPEVDKRDRLVLSYDARDDYGVERVLLQMVELRDGYDPATIFDQRAMEFDTQSGGFTETENRALKLDLTRHPLAGRKVIGRLVAIDGAEQRGVSDPLYFTVPDKVFVEPLAKAILEQRGLLLAGTAETAPDWAAPPRARTDMDVLDGTFDTYQTDWRMGRAPEPVQRTALLIEAVTDRPDPSLFNDPVVYMGLRHVGKTLRYARSADALDGLPEHMWKLAIRAEFGVLGTALQEMQEAQQALREGIARRAPQREIDTLFDRYNQAVDAYMEELRRNATVSEEEGGSGAPPMGSVDQIQELLDAIEEANRNGDTEGARRALAQLAELLENLEIQLAQGGQGESGEDSEMSQEQREQLEDLAETLGEQRELQDETRQAERDELRRELGEEETGESLSPEELSRRQAEIESRIESLRERLAEQGDRSAAGESGADEEAGGTGDEEGAEGGGGEELADGRSGARGTDMGETSGEAFDRARDAMRDSESALNEGDLRGSRQAQREAIEALREAGDVLSRELGRDDQAAQGEAEDPLGRQQGVFDSDTAESDIDPRDNAERSREILEELRRRAAEAERERQEQDYLERLLKRF